MPGNVADNQCRPVKCTEALRRVTIFRAIVDSAALLKVHHPLLGELTADNVMDKALQCSPIIRRYRLADMDVEAAVLPRHEQINVPLGYGPLLQQHLQQLVPEELFQSFGIVIRSDVEVPLLVKDSIGYDYVAAWIETEEVTECLDGAGTAGH